MFKSRYLLVWFDPNVKSQENLIYANKLREALDIEIKTFTKIEEAVIFIRTDGRYRRLLLLTCGSMG